MATYTNREERIGLVSATDFRGLRDNRALAEIVMGRAEALPMRDQALLRAVLVDGRSSVQVAVLARCDPRGVRRRVTKLIARVLSPMFLFVLREQAQWAPSRRIVARMTVLEGRSMREAAATLKTSLYNARRHYEAILSQFETTPAGRKAA